jgi:hypothetical protein
MLAARYHALRDRTLAAVDQTFAEPVQLAFLKNGAVDPARPGRDIEAPLRVGGGKETNVSGGRDSVWRTQIQAGRAELHIDQVKYPDLKFIKGDKVRALARPGQPWFVVLALDDRVQPRLVVQLGEA